MKKIVRKSVTWLLIFAMAFTPIFVGLDVEIVNASEDGLTLKVSDGDKTESYEFDPTNLNDAAKSEVSEAQSALDASAEAQAAADAAEDAAQDASGEKENAETYAGQAEELLNSLNDGAADLAAQVKEANDAYEKAQSEVADANTKLAAAQQLLNQAEQAVIDAATEQAKADAAILLADATAALTSAEADYQLKLQAVKNAASEVESLKSTAVEEAAKVNKSEATDAMSDASDLIDKALSPDKDTKNNESVIGYYYKQVGYVNDNDKKADDAKDAADQAIADAELAKDAAEQAIADAQTSKEELEQEVAQIEADTKQAIADLEQEVQDKIDNTDKFGVTAEQASEDALDAAKTAKNEAENYEALAAAAEARAKANLEAASKSFTDDTATRESLQNNVNAARAAATEAETFAKAAAAAATQAKDAEAKAKEAYDYLAKVLEDALKAAKEAEEDYNDKIDAANGTRETVNSDIDAANTLVGNYDNSIAGTKETIKAANEAADNANNHHGYLKGAEERADKAVAAADKAIETTDGKIAEQNGKIDAANTAIGNYNDGIDTLEGKKSDYDGSLEDYNDVVDEYNVLIDAANEAIESANEKIEAANDAMDAANGKISEISDDVSQAAEDLEDAKEKLSDAADALSDANDDYVNARTAVENAETAASNAEGFADTAATKADIAEAKAALTEDILAKSLTDEADYQTLVDKSNSADSAYAGAVADKEEKDAAALNTKNEGIAAAQDAKDAVDSVQNAILANYTSDQIKNASKTKSDTEKELDPSSHLNSSKISKLDAAKQVLEKGYYETTYKNILGQKKTETWTNISKTDAQKIVDEYNAANAILNAQAAKKDAADKYDATVNGENGIIKTYESAIAQTAKDVEDALKVKNAANAELAKVADFVATEENAAVLTAEEITLLAKIANGYGDEYTEFDKNDFSYLAANGDTEAYKKVVGATSFEDFGASLGNFFLGWLGFNFDDEKVDRKEAISDKYSNLEGYTYLAWKIEKKDNSNVDCLIEVTSDNCIVVCNDAERLATLRATLAQIKAQAAEEAASQAAEDARTAADEARANLDNYEDAKQEIQELADASLLPEKVDELTRGAFTDEEKIREYDPLDSLEKKSDETVKDGKDLYAYDDMDSIDKIDADDYDERVADYKDTEKQYKEDKAKNAALYSKENEKAKFDLDNDETLVELLKEIGIKVESIDEFKKDIDFPTFKELAEKVLEAKQKWEDAQEAAKDAEEAAKKAAEDAKRARRDANDTQSVLDIFDAYNTPGKGEGPTGGETFGEEPFELPTAGAASAVAGVRRNLVADAGDAAGEEVVADTTGTKVEEPVIIEEEELPAAQQPAQSATTIEEEPLPEAKAPEKAGFPWWILLIIAALGLGYAGYKYYDKKKNEDKVA